MQILKNTLPILQVHLFLSITLSVMVMRSKLLIVFLLTVK